MMRVVNEMKRRADQVKFCATPRRRGFAFTEVLFAVMVLGIGFIMIAAMFPVTIRQTQTTLEESEAASMARGAMVYLQTQATEENFPVTTASMGSARVRSMQEALPPRAAVGLAGWLATRGNYINAVNPRLAWVPMYRRGLDPDGFPSPLAQVFIVAVQARNKSQYFSLPGPQSSYSDIMPTAGAQSALEPRPIKVDLKYDSVNHNGMMTIDFGYLAAPGAYVIIAEDQNPPVPGKAAGQSNGRIYRLGNPIDEAGGVWSLAPDGDMIRQNGMTGGPVVTGDDNDLVKIKTEAYIIGRGYTDPANPVNGPDGYSGPAQDIGVYTGFIRIIPPVPAP